MGSVFYFVIAATIAAYVVLDGFDLGVGALHRALARTDGERRALLASIGPFWDGNEVWLIASGGLLFVAFPQALASALSGMYLAIFLVLWLLIGRGLSIELRNHLDDPMWRSLWDTLLVVCSLTLAILLGVALGNIVRGFQIDEHGDFALALFDDFSPASASGLLDCYTLATGVYAALALMLHGARFIALRCAEPLQARATKLAHTLAPICALALVGLTAMTWWVRPDLVGELRTRPWIALALTVAVAGLFVAWQREGRAAFVGSVAHLLGLLSATALAAYPELLHARSGISCSVTSCASADVSLRAALVWLPFAMLLALGYLVMLARLNRAKVTVDEVAETR